LSCGRRNSCGGRERKALWEMSTRSSPTKVISSSGNLPNLFLLTLNSVHTKKKNGAYTALLTYLLTLDGGKLLWEFWWYFGKEVGREVHGLEASVAEEMKHCVRHLHQLTAREIYKRVGVSCDGGGVSGCGLPKWPVFVAASHL
jgi:hypothetical protein